MESQRSDTTEQLSPESLESEPKRERDRKESVGNPRVLSYLSIPPTPTSLLPSYMNGACGHSFFFFLIEIYLVYNVVLVQVYTVIHLYIYIYIYFQIISLVGYYKI